MKYGIIAIVIVLALIVVGCRQKAPVSQQDASGNPYHGLRNQILGLDAKSAGIAEPTANAGVWAVLMETGYPKATVTLVALLNGNASLYFETGGGMIGGASHENVRNAAFAMATAADQFVQHCTKTDSFPLPDVGNTTFYVVTTEGVFTTTAKEEDLGEGRHQLSPLFHAGHEVISQLRMIQEGS